MAKLYTIGYEGTDIDHFIATLKEAGVKTVADVRAVACSRKKGFSKKGLGERLAENGIGYVHLVDLGDPKPGRVAARAGRYDEFLQIYRKHLSSDAAQQALLDLVKVARSRPTCLLCFECDAADCHRSIVADRLARFKFTIAHLRAEIAVCNVEHSERRPRRHLGESAAPA